MNEPKRPGISKRFLIGLFAVAVLGLLASGYGYYRREMSRIIRDQHEEIAAIGELKSQEIVQWRKERLANAQRAVDSPFFRNALKQWQESPQAPDVQAQWRQRLEIERQSFGYEDALLLDAGGNILLSAKNTPDPVDPVVKQAMEAAVIHRKAVLSDFFRCPKGIVHIDVAAPIFDAEKRLAAILVLHGNARDYLFPLIQSWPGLSPSPSAETLLVRREGKEIVFLNNLRHQSDTALTLRIPITRTHLPAVQAALGKRGIFEGRDYRGIPVLADLRPVPESPWFMVAKVDMDEAMARGRENARILMVFVLLCILFAAALFASVYRRRQAGLYQSLYESERKRRETEDEIRATLYGIGDGVISTDAAGRVRRMNPVAEQLTGWSESEICGKPLGDVFRIVNEMTRARVDNPAERVLREGVVVGLANHTLLIAKDGTERPIADSGAPIRDEEGRVTGVALVFRDQTVERTAREVLRESEKRYRLLAENTVDCIWLMDMNLIYQYVNPAIYEMTGYTPEEWIGTRISDHFDEKNLQRAIEAGQRALSCLPDLPSITSEVEIIRKNGETLPIEVVSKLLLDENNQVTGIQGVTRDISERKRIEKELRIQKLFFEQIFMQSSVSTHILDKEGWCERINPKCSEIFGVKPEQLEGRYNIFKDEGLIQGGVIRHLEKVFREKKTVEWEFCYDMGLAAESQNIPIKEKKKAWFQNWSYPVFDEKGDLNHVVIQHIDVSAQKQAEEDLRQSNNKLGSIFSAAPTGIGLVVDRVFTEVNQTFCNMVGYSREELIHRSARMIYPSDDDDTQAGEKKYGPIAVKGSGSVETRFKRKDGSLIEVILSSTPIDASDLSRGVMFTVLDITERKKLEDQLRQSQKMESVGRLAGGVAHDFNNMLQAIIGYAEMALDQVRGDGLLCDNIKEILKAAQRSADLTRQLLAFARKQTVNPKILDVNDTVSGTLKMLRRLIGEGIELVFKPGPGLWPVKIDPTQIDQILANLSVNARDAIAGVGHLTIETDNVVLDDAYTKIHAGFIPGEYVLLAVSDDGSGMDKQTLEILFEPFFTTKEVGKGTGLGLATVYGIVKQNDGFINVYSEPEHGTTFKIYLPRVVDMAPAGQEAVAKKPDGGHETVLLVEDEITILNFGKAVLERFGYTVLAASTPGEALAVARSHPGPIHLLVTDVVMPEMNGKELKDRLAGLRPEMKVMYMSGYTANVIAHHGVVDEGVRFLQKPFSVNSLAAKVREALEENDSRA